MSLLVEMELIDKYKKLNINLCNLTNGGEGVSGLNHSEKSKKLMSKKALGKKRTEEQKLKISESTKLAYKIRMGVEND
jgi:hypothetical protein